MRKAHAAAGSRDFGENMGLDGLVENVEQTVAIAAAHALEQIEIEFTAEHRREYEHPIAIGREVAQPTADHLSHALGNSELPKL